MHLSFLLQWRLAIFFFSLNKWIVNTGGCLGHIVSVAATQLCFVEIKDTDNT